MKKMKKQKLKQIPKAFHGSFTIEISILLPLTLLLITGILYLLFFLYDESCVEQISYLASLRGSRQMGSVEEKKKVVESYCQDMQEELLWAVKGKETEIDCTKSKVMVELKGEVNAPFGGKIFQNSWSYRINSKSETIKSVQIIRNCRKLADRSKR